MQFPARVCAAINLLPHVVCEDKTSDRSYSRAFLASAENRCEELRSITAAAVDSSRDILSSLIIPRAFPFPARVSQSVCIYIYIYMYIRISDSDGRSPVRRHPCRIDPAFSRRARNPHGRGRVRLGLASSPTRRRITRFVGG